MTISSRLFKRYYPDTSRSGTLFFYGWMRKQVALPCHALNLGAGPGDPPGSSDFAIRDMRCPEWRIDGCDPDPAVRNNAQLDRAVVMDTPDVLPFPDESFDVVYSDYVLEHVERPEVFLGEVIRVLKPGGSFFFRTPNVWHYVSVVARVTPHWVHVLVANRVRGLSADAHEPYPTYHRMNTRRVLLRLCAGTGFHHLEMIMFEAEPSYLVFNPLVFFAGVAYERTVNATALLSGLRANIMGRAVK